MPSNTRDLGLNQNGKGDKDRSDRAKFAARFPDKMSGEVDGFQRRGRRLVKVYGPRGNELRTRSVSQTKISQADLAKISPDFAQAQALADKQNAAFRAAGYDTCGY